nr:hypothetical protein [Micromonospora sp. DSM 115978]
YVMIAVLGVLGILRKHRGVVLAGVGGFLLIALVEAVRGSEALTEAYTVRFAGIFLVGAVMYLYAERIPINRWLLPVAVGLVGLSGAWSEAYLVFAPIGLGYLLLYAGKSAKLASVGAKRDLSYGIYI